jgi:L-rhamnose isomerase
MHNRILLAAHSVLIEAARHVRWDSDDFPDDEGDQMANRILCEAALRVREDLDK